MKDWKKIGVLVLFWQLEFLPIPVFCKSANEIVQTIITVLPLIVLLTAITLSIRQKKYKAFVWVPVIVFIFLLDWVLSDRKRKVCNSLIVYCNQQVKPENAFNPILGVVMQKEDSVVIYRWSFFTAPESSAELVYQTNHGQENIDEREEYIVINENWYYHKFDVEF